MGLQLPYGIDPTNPIPVDQRYGPWASLAAAKAGVPLALRYDGLTVNVIGSGEYWWTNDLSDTGLAVKTGGGGSVVTPITYYSLLSLKLLGTLVTGTTYQITDRELGIYVTAISTSELDTRGYVVQLTPKHDSTTNPNLIGTWYSWIDLQVVPFLAGQQAIWGGKVWTNLTGVAGTAVDDVTLDNVNWVEIPKGVTEDAYYGIVVHQIEYDLENDVIMKQWDKLLNVAGPITRDDIMLTGNSNALYSENFDGAVPGFTLTAEWIVDNSALPQSSGYAGASGNFFLGASNADTSTHTATLNNSISTIGISNIQVSWGAYKDFGGPNVIFEWSIDGTNWNEVSFADIAPLSYWDRIPKITLPKAAENAANLQLRWTYTGTATPFYYAMDDLEITYRTETYNTCTITQWLAFKDITYAWKGGALGDWHTIFYNNTSKYGFYNLSNADSFTFGTSIIRNNSFDYFKNNTYYDYSLIQNNVKCSFFNNDGPYFNYTYDNVNVEVSNNTTTPFAPIDHALCKDSYSRQCTGGVTQTANDYVRIQSIPGVDVNYSRNILISGSAAIGSISNCENLTFSSFTYPAFTNVKMPFETIMPTGLHATQAAINYGKSSGKEITVMLEYTNAYSLPVPKFLGQIIESNTRIVEAVLIVNNAVVNTGTPLLEWGVETDDELYCPPTDVISIQTTPLKISTIGPILTLGKRFRARITGGTLVVTISPNDPRLRVWIKMITY